MPLGLVVYGHAHAGHPRPVQSVSLQAFSVSSPPHVCSGQLRPGANYIPAVSALEALEATCTGTLVWSGLGATGSSGAPAKMRWIYLRSMCVEVIGYWQKVKTKVSFLNPRYSNKSQIRML